MQCPLCIETVLEPRFHGAIEVDVCPKCKGVWLDRGELDKLARDEPPAPRPQRSRDDRDDDDDRKRDSKPKSKKKRKKSLGDRLSDVLEDVLDFDFD